VTDELFYLIYSNQKGQWWRLERRGYTQYIEEAGRYPHAEAQAIVRGATVDWQISHYRVDPVTGVEYVSYDEVVVLAPECTEVAW